MPVDQTKPVEPLEYNPKRNITSAPIPVVKDTPPGLEEIYRALEHKALTAMQWYESHQQHNKRGARRTRGSAIVLGAVTTVIPSVIAFLPERITWWVFNDFSVVKLNPIATIVGVAAATMILLDKFYGFSSGWMRYVTTYQEIQANLEEFRINWRKQLLRLNSNRPPTDEQILGVYDFLAQFLKSINDSVKNETQGWITEFRGALSDIEKTVGEQRAAAMVATKNTSSGGISIVLADHDKLDDRLWTLQLDNRDPETKQGQSSAAIPQLEAGLYRLRIAGKRSGNPVAAEFVVTVKPGEIAEQKVDRLG